jgi:adenylate cyclase
VAASATRAAWPRPFATCAPGGFGERDFVLIDATLPAFALAFKASIAIETAHTLATTYLGRDAAARILRGEIDRGQVNTMHKVLWFSDLTGFTRIADTLPRDQLLGLLNAYADCLVGVVHGHDGKALKFMGDGILAVFDGAQEDACRRALDAAETARAAVARLNRERSAAHLPVTGFTLALHQGEVLYGNVGSRDRLDFTVIGPAVNELSRIQGMSRSLDQPILVSASFAAACGDQRARLVSLGRYALRGVERPQELFTLDIAQPDPV